MNTDYKCVKIVHLLITHSGVFCLDRGLKVLIKKIDNTGTVRTVRGRILPNTSNNGRLHVLSFF